MKLFYDEHEYPGPALLYGLERGVLYSYVSNCYLDGVVNYTEHVAAFMVARYEDAGHLDAIRDIESQAHAKVCRFDDVALMRKSFADLWLFYFDRDCSDCMIGRVSDTAENRQQMRDLIREIADNCWHNYRYRKTRPSHGTLIEFSEPGGWISW